MTQHGSSHTTLNAEVLNQQAITLFEAHQFTEAYHTFQSALELKPESIGINHNLGLVSWQIGKQAEAIQFLSRAHLLAPEDKAIGLDLSSAYHALGNTDAACAIVRSTLRWHPDDATLRESLISWDGDSETVVRIEAIPEKTIDLVGSWRDHQAYISIHPTVILGPGSSVTVNYRPASPGVCVSIGKNSQIFGGLHIQRPGATISIGERTQIGASTLIANTAIYVGNDVLMAWGITVMDNDSHSLIWEERANDVLQCGKDWRENPDNFIANKDWSHVRSRPIRINDRAWIGFNAAILKGVTIGEGAVVGAGSVVTKDVEPFTAVAGNPARTIKKLNAARHG